MITDLYEIARMTVDFYRQLLGSGIVGYKDLTAWLAGILEFVLPFECCEDLCRPVTLLEVRALQQSHLFMTGIACH